MLAILRGGVRLLGKNPNPNPMSNPTLDFLRQDPIFSAIRLTPPPLDLSSALGFGLPTKDRRTDPKRSCIALPPKVVSSLFIDLLGFLLRRGCCHADLVGSIKNGIVRPKFLLSSSNFRVSSSSSSSPSSSSSYCEAV